MIDMPEMAQHLDDARATLEIVLDWLSRCDSEDIDNAATDIQEIEFARGVVWTIQHSVTALQGSFTPYARPVNPHVAPARTEASL